MPLHVYKFGGVSVGSVAAIESVAHIVGGSAPTTQLVIVVSAMSGVTDMLLAGIHRSLAGEATLAIADDLLLRHATVADALIADSEVRRQLADEAEQLLKQFIWLCAAARACGAIAASTRDMIAALGERLSTPLVAAVLRAHGLAAQAIDAADLIVTDDRFGSAQPLIEPTAAQIADRLCPLLDQGIVPIVTGFLGATTSGLTTTLGRGGSDYSAAILGAALDADAVIFYKEVDGILTSDPRIVPAASLVPRLDYHEVAELAACGAKVLHPKTIQPLIDKQIPIYLKNTFNPEQRGTIVTAHAIADQRSIKAVAVLSGLSLLTLRGLGAHALPEITDRITALAAERGIRLLPSASGESQICCLLPSAQAALLHSHLKDDCAELPMSEWLAQIEMREQTALVSIIGRGIADDAGFLSRVVTLLDEQAIPVYRVAAGTADLSISLVVDASHAEQALRVVHVLTGSAQDACSVPLELCVGGEHSPMSVASGKTREQIAHFVRETLVRQGQLSCAPGLIADEDYLFSERLNMTSLGLINVVMAIEEGLGRSLGDELLIQARSGTVGDLIDWIDIACRSASTPQPQGSSVPRVAAQM